jgi:hypothetical protein
MNPESTRVWAINIHPKLPTVIKKEKRIPRAVRGRMVAKLAFFDKRRTMRRSPPAVVNLKAA